MPLTILTVVTPIKYLFIYFIFFWGGGGSWHRREQGGAGVAGAPNKLGKTGAFRLSLSFLYGPCFKYQEVMIGCHSGVSYGGFWQRYRDFSLRYADLGNCGGFGPSFRDNFQILNLNLWLANNVVKYPVTKN